jgi:hypothetical protein
VRCCSRVEVPHNFGLRHVTNPVSRGYPPSAKNMAMPPIFGERQVNNLVRPGSGSGLAGPPARQVVAT